jgi:two-component system OmpR family sensor kinase
VANPVSASFDRWWNGISLRAKVTGVTVFLLTLGLTVAGAGTMSVLRTYLVERVDESINTQEALLTGAVDIGDVRDYDGYAAAVSASGTLITDNLTGDQADFGPVLDDFTLAHVVALDGRHVTVLDASQTVEWRVTALPNAVGRGSEQATLVVGRNLSDTNALLGRYAAIFLLFAMAVVVLGAMGTHLLVTGAFMPLRDVERTAARFAAGDYSQRLGGATPNTEVGRLSRSLNTMLARIDRAFADRARTVDQMRRFVGDASHELRTPLVSLRGYLELLAAKGDGLDRAQRAQYLGIAVRQSERLGTLIDELFELAKLDFKGMTLQCERFALAELAADVAQKFQLEAEGRQVELRVVGAPARPCFVDADLGLMERVFENLVGNALRHTPAGGRVELRIGRDAEGLLVEVADTGRGIAAGDLPFIFDRFWRGDKSRTGRVNSGLGLAIARQLIQAHGGEINVESEVGTGTKFIIEIPVGHA